MGNAQNRERLASGSPSHRPDSGGARRRRHSSATPQDAGCTVTVPGCLLDPVIDAGAHRPGMRGATATRPPPPAHPLEPGEERDPTDPGPRRLPLVLQWRRDGLDVHVYGSFAGWRPLAMQRCKIKNEVEFMSIVNLPVGQHEYVFCVDGAWLVDDDQAVRTSATTGGLVNYTQVAEDDFQAMQALNQDLTTGPDEERGSPPGSYGQLVPVGPVWPKRGVCKPPALPPHLMNVILNQNTPDACEPTLLPAPNHVMLNHLYALSIRDGVMVVSATHRYRRKYVTTVLYKPI